MIRGAVAHDARHSFLAWTAIINHSPVQFCELFCGVGEQTLALQKLGLTGHAHDTDKGNSHICIASTRAHMCQSCTSHSKHMLLFQLGLIYIASFVSAFVAQANPSLTSVAPPDSLWPQTVCSDCCRMVCARLVLFAPAGCS